MPTKKAVRIHKWEVRVSYEDSAHLTASYTVYAVDALDARLIAFALDGGFPKAMDKMQDADVEYALTNTAIVKST